MIVYAVYSNYFDGCDFWDVLLDLYSSIELADAAMDELNSFNKDIERQSYYVRGIPVIEK